MKLQQNALQFHQECQSTHPELPVLAFRQDKTLSSGQSNNANKLRKKRIKTTLSDYFLIHDNKIIR